MERLTKFFTSLGGVLTGLAAVVAGVGALYLAFGGDGDGSPGDGSAQPATDTGAALEAWQTEANQICRTMGQRVRDFGEPTNRDELVSWLEAATPIFRAATNQIRAIERPPAQAPEIERFLANWDDQADGMDEAIQAAHAGDVASFDATAKEVGGLGVLGDRMAADLGLDECAAPVFD